VRFQDTIESVIFLLLDHLSALFVAGVGVAPLPLASNSV
jgi:hypothetical protein